MDTSTNLIQARLRRPAVAGYFYPDHPDALRQAVTELMITQHPQSVAKAVIVPHGSFRYAGTVLGATLGRTIIPARSIIVGPSHTGDWRPWSLMVRGAYRTPLGEVPIDAACAEALCARCAFLTPDAWGQAGEHAIEVVLPFLQYGGPPELSVVPILVGHDDVETCVQLGQAIAHVVRGQEEPVLLIASSDLSHYESQVDGASHDRALLEAIGALDGRRCVEIIQERSLVVCGAGAILCVLEAARALGATRTALICYRNSAEAGADPHSVIGYAGVQVS